MAFTSALVVGVAEYLHSVGAAVWRPAGGYLANEVAIFITASPPAPDRVVVLTSYPVDIGYGTNDVTEGLQVRTRGTVDPRTGMDVRDAAFAALDGLAHTVLNGIPIAQIFWRSGTPLGLDGNGRAEHTDNYYIQTARPSTNRAD